MVHSRHSRGVHGIRTVFFHGKRAPFPPKEMPIGALAFCFARSRSRRTSRRRTAVRIRTSWATFLSLPSCPLRPLTLRCPSSSRMHPNRLRMLLRHHRHHRRGLATARPRAPRRSRARAPSLTSLALQEASFRPSPSSVGPVAHRSGAPAHTSPPTTRAPGPSPAAPFPPLFGPYMRTCRWHIGLVLDLVVKLDDTAHWRIGFCDRTCIDIPTETADADTALVLLGVI